MPEQKSDPMFPVKLPPEKEKKLDPKAGDKFINNASADNYESLDKNSLKKRKSKQKVEKQKVQEQVFKKSFNIPLSVQHAWVRFQADQEVSGNKIYFGEFVTELVRKALKDYF